MAVPRIVITGAPASGKTDVLARLKAIPELAGVIFFDELARRLLEENPDFRDNWGAFHREIYRRQVEREKNTGDQPFITDRGTVDAFAFHPETMQDYHTTLEREYARYSAVIQLGSAAGLGAAFYVRDEIRTESIADVLEIEKRTTAVWSGHPAYTFIATEADFDNKYECCRRAVLKHIKGTGCL